MSFRLSRDGHRRSFACSAGICAALVLLPLAMGEGCLGNSDDDDKTPTYQPPPDPQDPGKTRSLRRRVVIKSRGGKIAVQEVLIWNVREKQWEEISSVRTELPSPGVGSGAGTASTSSGAGTTSQQGVRYPDLALFAGGVAGRATYASTTALLYDHAQETWTSLNMLAPRVGHTMTTLLDGRILIAGGWDGDLKTSPLNYQASTELFDPIARTFTATGSMNTTRINHAAARLLDGRVLITGGTAGTILGDTATAEIYDPATGVCTLTGSMSVTRTSHAAITLNDGRVLVVGSNNILSAEAYDPASGTFAALPDMNSLHGYGATATKLLDGRVLIIGGADENFIPSPAVEIFNPSANTFTPLPPLAQGRRNHSAVLTESDGTVLVCGGYSGNGDILASCLLFDPATDTFQPAPDMDNVNADFTGVYLERAEE